MTRLPTILARSSHAIRIAVLWVSAGSCARSLPAPRVVLVTMDGTRWQEVFRGADPTLLASPGGNPRPPAGLPPEVLRGTGEEKRRALMPFFWGTLAAQGQIFGNPDRASRVTLANPYRTSYPGYHEMLCGFPSPSITGNRRLPNPDPTVLEWLERRPGFGGRVAAYASWDVFAFILDRGRNGVLVDIGEPARPTLLDRLGAEVRPPWNDSVYDAFVFHRAMQHLREQQPRVLYIGLGDIDEWAHAGRYDRYLQAIVQSDRWLGELWTELQALPAYRARTSLVITTDHGRGDADAWRGHGADVAGAEAVWAAVLGPGTPALGERQNHAPLTLSQVAATIAALVHEDFAAAVPGAAPPLPLAEGGAR
jgi:Type I phosphodiesterase / nucleotide pyrophosphatase